MTTIVENSENDHHTAPEVNDDYEEANNDNSEDEFLRVAKEKER